MVVLVLVFKGLSILSPIVAVSIYIPINRAREFDVSLNYPPLCLKFYKYCQNV